MSSKFKIKKTVAQGLLPLLEKSMGVGPVFGAVVHSRQPFCYMNTIQLMWKSIFQIRLSSKTQT